MVTLLARPGAKRRSAPARADMTVPALAANCLDVIEVSSEMLLESVADGLVVVDGSGVIRAVNSHAATMFGHGRDDLMRRPIEDLVPLAAQAAHPSDVQSYLAHLSDRPMGEGLELSGLRKDGSEFPVDISLSAVETRQGRFVCASVREVIYSRLAAIVDSSTDAVIGTLLDGTITSWNAGAEHLYGYSAAEMVGHDHSAITPAGLRWELPAALRRISDGERLAHYVTQRSRRDGTAVDVSITVSPVRSRSGAVTGASTVARDVTEDMRNQAERGVVSNLHDVTDRVETAKLLAHQAMHDTLTELPNRALLLDRLDQALARAARSGRPCALLFIDLDRFKQVNDIMGHPAGDQLLKAVAVRLLQAIRPGDSVGRLGGDEFVVLAENIDEPATVTAIADRVRACIAEPITVAGKAVTMSGSVGIALSNQQNPEAVFQEADMALYRSKQSGRNRWEIYDQAMRTQAHQRQEIEDLVRAALSNGALALHYQPIVDLSSGAVIASEALARIRQPNGVLVNLGDFIAVAEDSGLIIPLGDAVLELACAQQARWQAAGSTRGHMAVNVSARQLGSDHFVSGVEKVMAACDLRPESLCIEITESTLIDVGSSTRGRIGELKDLGGLARPGRLRYRVVQPQLPAPLPLRRSQDRPELRCWVGHQP